MMMDEDDELDDGMVRKLKAFDNSLHNLETTLKPFLKIPVNDINDKVDDPLLKARLELMVAYSINSLFWAYLCTQGINAKQHPIRSELKRVQEYMGKVKLAEEKKKMARVDTHAAKRFLRNALWEAPGGSAKGSSNNDDHEEEEQEPEVEPKRAKLSNTGADEEAVSHKKSKKKKSKKQKKKKDEDT